MNKRDITNLLSRANMILLKDYNRLVLKHNPRLSHSHEIMEYTTPEEALQKQLRELKELTTLRTDIVDALSELQRDGDD